MLEFRIESKEQVSVKTTGATPEGDKQGLSDSELQQVPPWAVWPQSAIVRHWMPFLLFKPISLKSSFNII